MPYVLGVDLGAARVAAAVCRRTGDGWAAPVAVPLGTREPTMPAVVFLTGDGEPLVGDVAQRRAAVEADRLVGGLPARIADDIRVTVDGRSWTAPRLAARLLDRVVAAAVEQEGEAPARVAVTHPAHWSAPARARLRDVLLARGRPVALLSDAEAAAAHLACTTRIEPGATLAVHHLDGPTFAAGVVRRTPDGWVLLGPPPPADPGAAVDVEDVVFEHVRSALPPGVFADLDHADPAVAAALTRLRRDGAAAAAELGRDDDCVVPVQLPTSWTSVTLRRAEFEERIRPRVDASVDALHAALAAAGVTAAELTAVVLAGDSARMPIVARRVAERLGRPVLLADPGTGLARGAAIVARQAATGVAPAVRAAFPPPAAWAAAASTTADPVPAAAQPAPADREPAVGLDEDAQFTVYRPAGVRPMRWYPLLAFAHRTEPFVGEATGQHVDPVELVRRQADRLLADQSTRYGPVTADSELPLPRGADVVLQPWLSDGVVNPVEARFRWEEPVHRVEFRLRAGAGAEGRRITGGLRVFLGAMLAGEVSFAIAVGARQLARPKLEPVPVRRFRRIFASYSHLDAGVVGAVAEYAKVTGDRYLIDAADLRSGQPWQPGLAELIDRSDIFQLFWSRNAMNSSHVRQEWEYALSLGRDGFIRPVYWEEPRPVDPARKLPPEEIDALHWARLPAGPSPPPPVPARLDRPAPPRAADRPADGAAGEVGAGGEVGGGGQVGVDRPTATRPTATAPTATGRGRAHGTGGRRRLAAVAGGALAAAGVIAALTVPRVAADTVTAAAPPTLAPATWDPLETPQTTEPGSPPRTPDLQGAEDSPGGPTRVDSPALAGLVPSIDATIPVGAAPRDVVGTPRGRLAYVATAAGVAVVDPAAGRVAAVLRTPGGAPEHLAVAPDGARLYATVWDQLRASAAWVVLDPASGAVVATGPLPGRAGRPALTPDGGRLVVPCAPGSLVVLDAATGATISRHAVPPDPRWADVTADGRAVLAVAAGVAAVDLDTGLVRAPTAVADPTALAVLPGRPVVAVVDRAADTVALVDVDRGVRVAAGATGSRPTAVGWAPDGRRLYVTNADATLSVLDGRTLAVVATVPVGAAPGAVAVATDGSAAYVTNAGDGTLTVLDTSR